MNNDFINALSKEQQLAVEILRTFIDCYNSGDGIGLFSGVGRYNYLESRCKIAAIQARDLMGFWSILRQKLQCPIPPKKADSIITPLWQAENQNLILKELGTKAAECIMLARMLHDGDKTERKKIHLDTRALLAHDDFDDNIGDIL